MAKIYQPITQVTGTVGIIPSFRYTAFGDDLATVTSPGYLNVNNLEGISLSTNDIIEAFYSYNPMTEIGIKAEFSVGIANGVITLTQIGNGGGTGSGTVSAGSAGQLAYYNSSGTTVGGLTKANNGVLVTDSTGTPSISATLPNIALGTPTSATLTNATGLPLDAGTTGTLPISKGGTGITTTPTDGKLLIGNTAGGYTSANLIAGSNVTVTNGNGSITIAATGGSGSGTVNTGTANQLSYYSSDGTSVSGLATANSGVLVTSSTGVPSISATLPNIALGTPTSATLTNATGLPLTGTTGTLPINRGGTGITTAPSAGKLLIGNNAGGYTSANIIAGSNVTVTNGDGAITIAATGGGGGSVTLAANSGSATGSTITISGGTTGLTTVASDANLSLQGVLSVANGGTGVTSFPLPGTAIPIDDATIVAGYSDIYQNYIQLTPNTVNQEEVTPIYTIAGTSYFVLIGRPNLIVYSFDGTSATVVQTIYAGTNSYRFGSIAKYTLAGIDYIAVVLIRNTAPNSSILQVYSWNGTAYVQVGSDLLYTASLFNQIVYFVIAGTSYVAITDGSNNRILLFSWNGTAYVQVGSPISTQSVSVANALVYYTISSVNYLTVSDEFKGISTYQWNGTTFVQVSAQTISGAEFKNFSFFTSESNYYIAATGANYLMLLQWNSSTTNYTAIQTISGTYGQGIATFSIDSNLYMNATLVNSGVYYVASYIWNGTDFTLMTQKVLPTNIDAALTASVYNSTTYVMIGSDSNFFNIYQFIPTTVIAAGLIPVANGGTGLTAVPANGQLLIGNTTGYALSTLTAGTNVAINNTAGSIEIACSKALINVQYFAAGTGTYTKTPGTNSILVQCIAAGGGAGGSFVSSGGATSGGAGGGAFAQKFYATAPDTATYSVGAAGVGGAGPVNGTAGGDTTFTSTQGNMAVTGGAGTVFVNSTAGAAITVGGLGGTIGSGDTSNIVFPGANGSPGIQISNIVRTSGSGGASGNGSGGAIGRVNGVTSDGNNATGFGGGGSGSTASIGFGTGGNGANGLITIFEYS